MVKKEVRESELLFLYLHGTAGVTWSVVLQPIISQILIKWPLMLVFALSQLFCFVKLSCMPFWLSVRLFYRSYIREDLHYFPLKNDFSRILNAVLSIQDAYDQDQGIFSVLIKKEVRGSGLLFLEKRRKVFGGAIGLKIPVNTKEDDVITKAAAHVREKDAIVMYHNGSI